MAQHRHRAKVRAADGRRIKAISENEALGLVAKGQAIKLTTNRDLAHGKPLEIQLTPGVKQSPASITFRDVVRNADAACDGGNNLSRRKVEQWPEVHDTFAVTIVAGRGAWIPNAAEALLRSVAMAPLVRRTHLNAAQ